MICRHSGKLTHWFTSNKKEWEIRWCERCGALQKYSLTYKKHQWLLPQWSKDYQEVVKRKKKASGKSFKKPLKKTVKIR